jgi:plasmid stability protein
LPEDVIKEMRALAKEHTRSLNSEVLVALREYIKQQRQGLKPNTPYHMG